MVEREHPTHGRVSRTGVFVLLGIAVASFLGGFILRKREDGNAQRLEVLLGAVFGLAWLAMGIWVLWRFSRARCAVCRRSLKRRSADRTHSFYACASCKILWRSRFVAFIPYYRS
jgi:high-affinity Fe2+/Pb2+ permease